MTNILHNGSFEEGQQLLPPRVYHEGEWKKIDPPMNTFVPDDWVFFSILEDGNQLPECHLTADLTRVCEGTRAFAYFAQFKPYTAGLYQRVEIEGRGYVTVFLRSKKLWGFKFGDSYWDDVVLTLDNDVFTLTAWAHAWSNHEIEGFEHYGEPFCSVAPEPRCCGPQFWWEGEAPPICGDPLSDAIQNFAFHVGIDRHGGIDPLSPYVEWSRGAHIYNGYAPLTLQAPAWWRGKPREQYERTYVLLPPGAGKAWANAVVEARWDSDRWTVGGSADDAGIGDLDVKTVIAVNPHLWGDDLCAWYAEHYPGVAYVPIEAATPDELAGKLGA